MSQRTADIHRKTRETDITLQLAIDGTGEYAISTGIGFFDHMLELFTKHGRFDLSLRCVGDLHIDGHHTVEDIGIALGEAFAKAIGDKKGIARYGFFIVPMDETLAQCALDFSGRPYFVFSGELPASEPGGFATELTLDFFKAFSDAAKINLHLKLEYGRNSHHCLEALFKATARAMRLACTRDLNDSTIPSTKGRL